jgi:hypothetical protein
MDEMVTMSVRLPKQVVTWLRKTAAVETIEQDKRVSMNSLLIDVLTKAMNADRRVITRYAGSGSAMNTRREGGE